MDEERKYIRYKADDEEIVEMVIFPSGLFHAGIHLVLLENSIVLSHPISAGFIDKDGHCYGCSVSLGLEALEDDDKYIANAIHLEKQKE